MYSSEWPAAVGAVRGGGVGGHALEACKNALVPRYEVRPCMLALYFLGETSKVFRLVKTSKVFARKHRRCFR